MFWKKVIEWVCFASGFGITYVGFLLQVLLFIAHPEEACSLLIYEFQWLYLLYCPSVMCGSVVKPTQCPHHSSSDFITLVVGITLWFCAPMLWGLGRGYRRHKNMMPLYYVGFHSNSGIVLIKLWLGSNRFLRLFFSWEMWSNPHYMELHIPDYFILFFFFPGRRVLLFICALPYWLTRPLFNWRFFLWMTAISICKRHSMIQCLFLK